jgi:hypothetical protein
MRNSPLIRSVALVMAISLFGAASVPVGAQDDTAAAVATVMPERSLSLTPPEGVALPYDYRFTRADRLLAAQACVHEATWAGANRTADCGGIIQVTMERRHHGESFSRALELRTMPRFYDGVTSRSWTRHLPAGLLRVDPPGWPYDYPARVHDDDWLAVNQRVAGYMRGTEPLPCSPTPGRWFGRATDSEALRTTLATGHWCEAICGESRNAFLTRCATTPAPESTPEPSDSAPAVGALLPEVAGDE